MRMKLNKNNCSGCGLCANKCPLNAISMKEDEEGFLYPEIDNDLCIDCGKCKETCPLTNDIEMHKPIQCFAAVARNKSELANSSSGGFFFQAAKYWIEHKGVAYGVAYDETMVPVHIAVSKLNELERTQGSKYIQSSIQACFSEIQKDIKLGKSILFSGTPCQVAAVRKAFADENILLVDVVCHGVPSAFMWKQYVEYLERKNNGELIDYKFRSKSSCNPFMAKYYIKKQHIIKEKRDNATVSYYYDAFLNCESFRPACYYCKFACKERVADITIADFWGYKGTLNSADGISAVIANTSKGLSFVKLLSDYIDLEDASFSDIVENNGQLVYPSDLNKRNKKLVAECYAGNLDSVIVKHFKKHWKGIIASKFGVFK